MITWKNGNNLVFNSISELFDELDNSKELPDRDNSSDNERGYDWCDTNSYNEARINMIDGKIYDGLDIDVEHYRTKGSGIKSINRLDVVGHSVVVPLYLQGIPNCMINSKRVINNKIINVFYSPQAPCGVSQDRLISGATKLFKKVIALERDGYRVNLYVIECQENFGYCIKLKTDRETLNIKKLCFPIISSSMLRRIGFKIKERLYEDWIGWGYGRGTFELEDYEKFISNKLHIRNYEIWNYQGKQN